MLSLIRMPVSDPTASAQIFTYSMVALVVTALTVSVGYGWWNSSMTTPVVQGFQAGAQVGAQRLVRNIPVEEGFAGPAVGAGEPNCMGTSKDAATLYDMLNTRTVKTDDGPDDLRELKVILSKISCMKRDLLGNAKVVQATRYQPFSTSHDLEPVAETTARCFSRTIPQRDLSLSLDKWGSRGTFLIKRLCTAENLSDAEEKEALRLFGDAMADLADIALAECCNAGKAVIGGIDSPRMVAGYSPPTSISLRKYDGYY
jgi:hypothetical protein